jgi:hypothetical protein
VHLSRVDIGLLVPKHTPGSIKQKEQKMTGEQFLNSIRYLDCEINALDYERVKVMDQRQALLDAAQTWGGLTGVCVQHSPGSRTESIGIQLASLITPEDVARKINQYQERINRKINRLVDMKNRALTTIDKIDDPQFRILLTLRYIRNIKWSSVADLMGYTINWIMNDLKHRAIKAFEAAENNH